MVSIGYLRTPVSENTGGREKTSKVAIVFGNTVGYKVAATFRGGRLNIYTHPLISKLSVPATVLY